MDARFRWKHSYTSLSIICSVWFMCHIDRVVMAVTIPFIATEFGLKPLEMGGVMSAFFLGYAACQIPGGILADRFGPRKVLAAAVLWWSTFTAVTGMAASLGTMLVYRVIFGVGEGIAPAATWKAAANWTPMSQRAMGTALMMAATVLAPAVTPWFIASLIGVYGWRLVYYLLFIPGAALVAWIWFALPDNPADKRGITREELEELEEKPSEVGAKMATSQMSFWQIVSEEAVWKSFLILFFSNMVSYGFVVWLPSYLKLARKITLQNLGWAASVPFVAGAVGFILAGWLGDHAFKNNRKVPLILSQWIIAAVLYMTYTSQTLGNLFFWQTVSGFFIFFATGSVYNLPVTLIPREIAGRAMGVVNMAGQIAGFISPIVAGWLIQSTGNGNNYDAAFIYFAAASIVSSLIALTWRARSAGAAAMEGAVSAR